MTTLAIADPKFTITPTGIVYPREAYAAVFLLLIVMAVVSLVSTCFIRETRGMPLRDTASPISPTFGEVG